MKKIFSAALCAATLGLGLVGAAQADTFTFVGATETDGAAALPFSVTETTAGTFSDTFLFFNAPSYSLDTYVGSAGTGLTFTGVQLVPDSGGSAVALTGSLSGVKFSYAPSAVLPGAGWDLIVSGTAVAGSTYTVSFTSNFTDAPSAAVPEPANWALLMLGGAGLFGARKLKGARKSSPQALAA